MKRLLTYTVAILIVALVVMTLVAKRQYDHNNELSYKLAESLMVQTSLRSEVTALRESSLTIETQRNEIEQIHRDAETSTRSAIKKHTDWSDSRVPADITSGVCNVVNCTADH